VSVTATAPVVAPPIATVVPAPSALAVAADAELTIDSTPKDVEIYLGKEKLGTSAKPLRLKRSDAKVKLTFKAPGYVAQDAEVSTATDAHVAITLVKIGGGHKKAGGGDLEY
jgi:serine/threonine-protein kinase